MERDAAHWAAVEEATELLHEERFREALELLRDVIRADPENPYAFFFLGQALYEVGELQPSCVAYRAALRLAPQHLGARVALTHVLRKLGESRAAVAEGERPELGLTGGIDRTRQREIALDAHRAGADCDPALRDLAQGRARRNLVGRQAVDFGEGPVGDDEPRLAIKQADACGNVVDRGLVARRLRLQARDQGLAITRDRLVGLGCSPQEGGHASVFLRALGADFAQGWFYGPPVTLEELLVQVRADRTAIMLEVVARPAAA